MKFDDERIVQGLKKIPLGQGIRLLVFVFDVGLVDDFHGVASRWFMANLQLSLS